MNRALLRLAALWAGRELRFGLRGGLRGLRIVIACLALGVAAIAAIGSLRAGIARGLASDGRALLGGDLVVDAGAADLPPALLDRVRAQGIAPSSVTTLRSLLAAANGERALIDLKAVDAAYPLAGTLRLQPPQPLPEALAMRDGVPGLVVEQIIASRLGVQPGALLKLGDTRFRLAAILAQEPDRVVGPFAAPRAIIAAAALPGTGLIQPGSMVDHALRLRLPPGMAPAQAARGLRAAFPGTGWRIRDTRDAVPGLERFIDQTAAFLTLVGLSALLVGGIGVATGVRAWLESRAASLATLRCLGASSRLIFATCLIQVMALAGIGVVIGLVIGAALPLAAAQALGSLLPVPPRAGIYPGPLLIAAAYGLLTAAGFALWPLGRAAAIPGAALFRDRMLPARLHAPRLLAANTGLVALLVALITAGSAQPRFAAWFCAGAAAALILFRLGGTALVFLARHAPRLPHPAWQLGVLNLHRPGSTAALLLVATGLGLTSLATVAAVERNITAQLRQDMPQDAPAFYFIDIQPGQRERFRDLLQGMPGVRAVREVPNLRARIVTVHGIRAEQLHTTPGTGWALRGDCGLTYAATPPEGTLLMSGHWWPADYAGKPLVSLDAGLARGWGVHLGDVIRVNVLGRDIDLTVTSLRDITWRRLGLNFALVASPGLLDHAPHTDVATVQSDPAQDGAILRRVSDALPNVTGINVRDVLAAVAGLAAHIGTALQAAGAVTLASGVLVLAGAVASGQRRRQHDAVVLRALGATSGQLRTAFLVEFGLIGAAAGLMAAGIAALASWAVMRFLLQAPFHLLPWTLAGTVAFCTLLMLVLGLIGTEAALHARPSGRLRDS